MTDIPRRKRLIEIAFPLEEVSAHSRREKNVRHGHISRRSTSGGRGDRWRRAAPSSTHRWSTTPIRTPSARSC